MQKQKLEILSPREIIRLLDNAFTITPIVPRDCVKAMNQLCFNLQRQEFSPEIYREVVSLVLRGFTSKDQYLKSLIYAILEEISKKTGDGILSINCILKDIDDKAIPHSMKNSAFRALFTNLPSAMRYDYDFEKYIKTAIIDDNLRDNAVCLASEYFPEIKIKAKTLERIDDYHLSFFNRLPVNKYSSMLEIKRILREGGDVSMISQYLTASTDKITFFEAARGLVELKQEHAAPLVDKAVSVLKMYLKKRPEEVFCAMKVLSKLSINFPTKVAKANREIEDLVQESSKTVSMLAILTLMKTGTDETVRQLASKLEPLMQTMSESYRTMAIETMEKLSKGSKVEFVGFLKNALLDHVEIGFKRFILRKLEVLLKHEDHQGNIVKFLCTYIEDPEFYQLSMDMLGILGCHLSNPKDLIHVYNRLILDNPHVRSCAFQTLYDLDDKFQTIESFKDLNDPETSKIRSFLYSNSKLSKDSFDMKELGDLKGEVMKYLNTEAFTEEEGEKAEEADLIKECRSLFITPEGSDFEISVIKRIFKERILLEFTIENKMEKIIVNSAVLALDSENSKFVIEIAREDFKDSKKIVKEIELMSIAEDVFNGVFEYEICLQEDYEDVENDSISLIPFDINVLDFIRPVSIDLAEPTNSRSLELKFKSKPTEAISRIVTAANMFLIADKDSFELRGTYERQPVLIKGNALFTKYTVIDMQIMCDDDNVIDQIVSVFD